jgi:hypothetical protein
MMSFSIHNITSIKMEAVRLHQGFASRTLVIKTQSKYDDHPEIHKINLYSELSKQLIPISDTEIIRYPMESDDAPDQTAA